jgi:hypothetical protein
MSRFDTGAAVPGDRSRFIPAGPRPAGGETEPVRDSAASKADCRDLIVVNPKQTPPKGKPSRYADALFLAHVFASKFAAPQQREKRRADPADANASYRKSAKRPVKTGRVLSKKI